MSDNQLLLEISRSTESESWNKQIGNLPNCSILQSWQWGEIKSRHGWEPIFFLWKSVKTVRAAAMALVREKKVSPLNYRIKIMYIPHGPLMDWRDDGLVSQVLLDLQSFGSDGNYIFIKIDPQIIKATGIQDELGYESDAEAVKNQEFLDRSGWLYSNQQIQFKNTFIINLQHTEDEILSRMKQKTRYNIRLAGRKNVNVRQIEVKELEMLYEMYAATSLRDGFIIRPKEYYLDIWETMMHANMASPLVAEVEGEPIAGLILFHFHKRSYYFYGMSVESHRDKMPNHLLQWEAIKLSKALGCQEYDLWGAPDDFSETDRMWGVYKFKDGFGGKIHQTIGAYDYSISKVKYKIFSIILPKVLSVMRKTRFRQIRQEIN